MALVWLSHSPSFTKKRVPALPFNIEKDRSQIRRQTSVEIKCRIPFGLQQCEQ